MVTVATGLALGGVVVTFVDVVRAPHWREVAAEGRVAWERGATGPVSVGSSGAA